MSEHNLCKITGFNVSRKSILLEVIKINLRISFVSRNYISEGEQIKLHVDFKNNDSRNYSKEDEDLRETMNEIIHELFEWKSTATTTAASTPTSIDCNYLFITNTYVRKDQQNTLTK